MKNEDSKVALTQGPISDKNSFRKLFSLKHFYGKRKINHFNSEKSRNIPYFLNCARTTTNDSDNKTIKNRIQAINNMANNIKNVRSEKKLINKIPLDEIITNKTNYSSNRNNFRDSLFFNNQEKKRIYKSYFSVENKAKNDKKKYNKKNNFNTLNYENTKYQNKTQRNLLIKDLIDNSYYTMRKENINNRVIKNKKYIFEINKYKNKISKLKNDISKKKIKLEKIQKENNKIELYLKNKNKFKKINNEKELIIQKISKLIKDNNYIEYNSNYIDNDIFKIVIKLQNEYNEIKTINNIIQLIKEFYLEYNYSFSSNETKKIINYKDISNKILWNWIKNVPKLIFYEKIKNNLNKNKINIQNYQIFIQYLFDIFEINSIKELQMHLNKLIQHK